MGPDQICCRVTNLRNPAATFDGCQGTSRGPEDGPASSKSCLRWRPAVPACDLERWSAPPDVRARTWHGCRGRALTLDSAATRLWRIESPHRLSGTKSFAGVVAIAAGTRRLSRPLLTAIRQTEPTVLLVDETDKADVEVEGLLLEVLSDFQVTVPELGTIEATRRPFVVLTSNATRELSEALKRRCLFLHVDYPDADREKAIVLSRVPEVVEELAEALVRTIRTLRALELKKAPSIAESIDWARTLVVLGIETLDEEAVARTLGVVLKHSSDQARAVKELGLEPAGWPPTRTTVAATPDPRRRPGRPSRLLHGGAATRRPAGLDGRVARRRSGDYRGRPARSRPAAGRVRRHRGQAPGAPPGLRPALRPVVAVGDSATGTSSTTPSADAASSTRSTLPTSTACATSCATGCATCCSPATTRRCAGSPARRSTVSAGPKAASPAGSRGSPTGCCAR